MKDDYTTNSHYLTRTFFFRKVEGMYFLIKLRNAASDLEEKRSVVEDASVYLADRQDVGVEARLEFADRQLVAEARQRVTLHRAAHALAHEAARGRKARARDSSERNTRGHGTDDGRW